MINLNRSSLEMEQFDIVSQIYESYYSKIYKYILYRVSNHDTAEDLVSDVFEKVLINYHTYKPEKGKISTWLFTIANNTIINYFKKNLNKPQSINIENIQCKYRLEDLIIEQELKKYLLNAIKLLDERQTNIIALKFGANLTNREIANILELSESNVGTILYRAIKQLKDILKEQGVI